MSFMPFTRLKRFVALDKLNVEEIHVARDPLRSKLQRESDLFLRLFSMNYKSQIYNINRSCLRV